MPSESEDWSRQENEAIVASYLKMLAEQQAGIRYNKSAYRRELSPLLRERTDGAIEHKHMNISAVMIDLGYPYVEGYKPYSNYQESLAEVVADRVSADNQLAARVQETVSAPAAVPQVGDLLSRLEEPPIPSKEETYTKLSEVRTRMRPTKNWLEIESRNVSLGRAGEEFVVAFEKERLRVAGKAKLAERVEHVALSVDSAGFDVRSFETSGHDRLIEVKTTSYGKLIPFFLSRNEVRVSRLKAGSYHLYRLFHFREDPRLYSLHGALEDRCYLDPVQFSARVR